jgi:hypothetical protein
MLRIFSITMSLGPPSRSQPLVVEVFHDEIDDVVFLKASNTNALSLAVAVAATLAVSTSTSRDMTP